MSFLAPIAKAVLPAVAQAGTSFGLSKLGGQGGSSGGGVSSFRPGGISAGGLSTSTTGRGTTTVRAEPERMALVNNISGLFPQQANLVRGLRESVAPGVGLFTRSRLDRLADRRRASIGNLKDNLARRRVLGSSFAEADVGRREAEFDRMADEIEAESFLRSLDLTNQLANQEFDLRRNEFQTRLNEMNLQADIARGLSAAATQQMGANARLQAQLAANESAASGSMFGQLAAPISRAVGSGVSNAFGGGNSGFTTVTTDAAGNVL